MRQSRGGGFTLVEMLVVVAIIAILASIMFPVFSRARAAARKAACASNLRQIGTAFELYVSDNDECFPYVYNDCPAITSPPNLNAGVCCVHRFGHQRGSRRINERGESVSRAK